MEMWKEDTGRRDVLKLLGIGTVGAAVSTEALADAEVSNKHGLPALFRPSIENQEKICQAMENLAKSIRNGSAAVHTLEVNSKVSSKDGGAWMDHVLTIHVEILSSEETS